MSKDESVIVCRHCGETKKRILKGRYPNGKDKKWVDEQGREFNGLTCSTCHAEKVLQRKNLKAKNRYV